MAGGPNVGSTRAMNIRDPQHPSESGFLQDGVKHAVPDIVRIKDPAVLIAEDPLGTCRALGRRIEVLGRQVVSYPSGASRVLKK